MWEWHVHWKGDKFSCMYKHQLKCSLNDFSFSRAWKNSWWSQKPYDNGNNSFFKKIAVWQTEQRNWCEVTSSHSTQRNGNQVWRTLMSSRPISDKEGKGQANQELKPTRFGHVNYVWNQVCIWLVTSCICQVWFIKMQSQRSKMVFIPRPSLPWTSFHATRIMPD